ncbi:Reverse transcriptase domain [Trinorchestia longiramus]|nr:Reverse transcriptase domain [Trinorchestia longiramus]
MAEVEWQGAWDEYKVQQKKVKRMIYEARVKDERQKVENIRNKGPDGIKEWYNFIQGNNRSNEIQIHELVVGCKVSDHGQMVKAVVDFWEDIGGMNKPLIDEEPVTLQIGEYVLKIENEITSVEIETLLKKVKNGKASGPDDIPYEFYKHSGESKIEMLRCLFDEIWRSERVPDEWNKCNLVLLHKGGHKNMKEIKNYRPIALADTVNKIFCRILNERMKHVVEEQGVMGEEQNGFRRDRRGEDNLFVVSEVIVRKRKENKKVYLAFLDIEKAYDKVDHRKMLDVLGKIGFSEKIVNVVKSLYENTCAVYRLGNLVTGQVRSVRGVRQGCTLSSLLFGLYMEELAVCLRMSGFGLKVGEEKLSCLLYADDIVVVSESEQELQMMLEIVDGYSRDFKVNLEEIKVKSWL